MLMGPIKILLVSLTFILTFSIAFSKKGTAKKKHRSKALSNETYVQEITDFALFNQTQQTYFLLIYASYSGNSKKFLPIYDKASVLAKKAGWKQVAFAKANVPNGINITREFKYSTFPAIYWVNNLEKDVTEYDGAKTAEAMVKFINSMLNVTADEIKDLERLKKKISSKAGKHIVFVGGIESPPINREFRKIYKIAKDDNYESILWSKSPEMFKTFSIPQNEFDVVVFNVAKKVVDSGTRMKLVPHMSRESIEKYMTIFSRKLWGRFGNEELEDAIDETSVTPTMFIIYDKNDTKSEPLGNLFEKMAEKYKMDYWFLNTTYDSKYSYIFKEVFNVSQEKLPFLVMVENNDNNIDDLDKYVFPAEIPVTEASIEKFLEDFKNKKLKKFICSEKKPAAEKDANGIVKVVGYTFDDLVWNNPGKDVLLVLCVENSKRCKSLNERLARVAKMLTSSNPNFIMARIETSFNEITYIHYHAIPSIALIPGFNTIEERINNTKLYEGELTTPGIVNFTKQFAKTPLNVQILENEETVFNEEKKKIIKQEDKDKEEEVSNLEDEVSTGLRRTVFTEIDRDYLENDDDLEDIKEDDKELYEIAKQIKAELKKSETEKKKRRKREDL